MPTTVRAESTEHPNTRAPPSASTLTASASRIGSDQLPVKMTVTEASGFARCAPSAKALTLRMTGGKRLEATNATLPSFAIEPATKPARNCPSCMWPK